MCWVSLCTTGVLLLPHICREGKTSWQDLDLDDVDVRLKWAGLFHRRKRTPGRFMMRLKVGGAAGWALQRDCQRTHFARLRASALLPAPHRHAVMLPNWFPPPNNRCPTES